MQLLISQVAVLCAASEVVTEVRVGLVETLAVLALGVVTDAGEVQDGVRDSVAECLVHTTVSFVLGCE